MTSGPVYVTIAFEVESEEDAEDLFWWGIDQLTMKREKRPLRLRLRDRGDIHVIFINAWKGASKERIRP
jgi:hypothetical protein